MREKRTKRHSMRLEETAYHEAGHAVAAYWMGAPLKLVSIRRLGSSLGRVKHVPPFRGLKLSPRYNSILSRARLENAVIIVLAGHGALRRFNPKTKDRSGRLDDYKQAIYCLSFFSGSSRETEAYLRWLEIRTKEILKQKQVWNAVKALARALLEKKTLKGPEAEKIIETAFANVLKPVKEKQG